MRTIAMCISLGAMWTFEETLSISTHKKDSVSKLTHVLVPNRKIIFCIWSVGIYVKGGRNKKRGKDYYKSFPSIPDLEL